MDILYYLALYWIGHSYLAFKFKNAASRLNLKAFSYRIWLFALDVITLQTMRFKNVYAEFNRYPIVFSFSILFYFVCRHCLRNQRQYQSAVNIYHPNTHLYFYGHYYIGFFYSVFDFVLKYSIVFVSLHIHIALGMAFLMGLSFLDVWFYYNNITDSTSAIFHKLVGFLFHLVQPK